MMVAHQLRPGNWIKVKRQPAAAPGAAASLPYWHHGIVSEVPQSVEEAQAESDGTGVKVIHACLLEGRQEQAVILETTLERFLAGGDGARVVDAEPAFDYDEVVQRAKEHLGRGGGDLPTANYERFPSWCYEGASRASPHRTSIAYAAGAVIGAFVGVLATFAGMAMVHPRDPNDPQGRTAVKVMSALDVVSMAGVLRKRDRR